MKNDRRSHKALVDAHIAPGAPGALGWIGASRRAIPLRVRAACCIAAAILASCERSPPRPQGANSPPLVAGRAGGQRPAIAAGDLGEARDETVKAALPVNVVQSVEPWTYDSTEGKLVTTSAYRIFTTSTREGLVGRYPRFAEAALAHYRTIITPLPEPIGAMETYLMGSRQHWESLTQRLMGEDAGTYLQIRRGGFSANGKAVLYDIGPRDSFTIAAHEGWHQYTQRTFKDHLPVSIEEGLATYMEGFRWTGEARDNPKFMPWANFERFYQLRTCVANESLLPLPQLLRSTPQDMMRDGQTSVLDYYAQVWGLVHFLMEGDDGVYADALRAMVKDASAGGLVSKVRGKLGDRAAQALQYRKRGVDVLAVYTGKTAEELDASYRAFVAEITKLGAPQSLSEGRSPLGGK